MNEDLTATIDETTMSPEDWQLLKALQERAKKAKKQLSGMKESLFDDLTDQFAGLISQCQKDVVTVSTSIQPDGNIYSVTFGKEVPDDQGSINTVELAQQIIDAFLPTIEPIMGISSSTKVSGEKDGDKLFWQIRKRSSVKE